MSSTVGGLASFHIVKSRIILTTAKILPNYQSPLCILVSTRPSRNHRFKCNYIYLFKYKRVPTVESVSLKCKLAIIDIIDSRMTNYIFFLVITDSHTRMISRWKNNFYFLLQFIIMYYFFSIKYHYRSYPQSKLSNRQKNFQCFI